MTPPGTRAVSVAEMVEACEAASRLSDLRAHQSAHRVVKQVYQAEARILRAAAARLKEMGDG